jgi:hypothetical protein
MCALQLQKQGVDESAVIRGPREDQHQTKRPRFTKNLSEEAATHQFLGLLVGEHREKPRRRPRISRLPDRLRHTALDLVQQRGCRRSHSPRPGGSVGPHFTKTEQLPPKRHVPPGVVLADDSHEGDSGSSEAPQHRPVVPKHPLLLRLWGTMGLVRPRLPDGVPRNAGSANSGSFLR